MKRNMIILIIGLLVCWIAPVLIWNAMQVDGTNCFKIIMPVYAEIYSESNLASNIVVEVQPNDMIYFCGDEK